MEFRKPYPLEEKHFVELVTFFQRRQVKTGKNQTKQLRAAVVRFGYKASKAGLRVYDEPDVQVDAEAIDTYVDLMERVSGSSQKNLF